MNSYRLVIRTLTPLHIGTGEAYQPTNFVIDNGTLYEFDEVAFYHQLTPQDKERFNKIVVNWLDVIDFYRSRVEEAKAISFFECSVSQEVERSYKRINNQNQFQIHQTFKNPNTHKPIISGSSLKGMMDTVFKIYSPKSSNDIRQKLILSDATLLEGGVEVGYAYRIHKTPTKSAKSKIPQIVEVIKPNSTFLLTLKTAYSFGEIQEMMKCYYSDRKNSIIKTNIDAFVARVGKYCGKEYMVDDIKNGLNSFQKPVATHTLYERGNQPFGWIEIEDVVAKEKRIDKEQKEEKARLDAMSPFEQKLEQLIADNSNPNEQVNIIIFNAIKNGQLECCQCEALMFVKEQMMVSKTWIETSKKPKKDKKYRRTLEVIEMLNDCDKLR